MAPVLVGFLLFPHQFVASVVQSGFSDCYASRGAPGAPLEIASYFAVLAKGSVRPCEAMGFAMTKNGSKSVPDVARPS